MNKELTHKIEQTLDSAEFIDKITVSKDFKQHLLDRVEKEKKGKELELWFKPKFQVAATIIILLVNALVISYVFNSQSETSIDTFAQEYSLKDENTLFN